MFVHQVFLFAKEQQLFKLNYGWLFDREENGQGGYLFMSNLSAIGSLTSSTWNKPSTMKINANEMRIWIRIVSIAVLLILVNAGKYEMQKQDFQSKTKSFPFINYSLNQTHTNYRMEYTMYREKLRPEKCNPQEILTSKTSCNFTSLNYIVSLIPLF
jgi:hypothetical protein